MLLAKVSNKSHIAKFLDAFSANNVKNYLHFPTFYRNFAQEKKDWLFSGLIPWLTRNDTTTRPCSYDTPRNKQPNNKKNKATIQPNNKTTKQQEMTSERIIIADNQPLTALAVETLAKDILGTTGAEIVYADCKQCLSALLRENKRTAVVLDYTLFDFANSESLVIMSEANPTTTWLLLSDELTADFLRYVLYETQHIGVAYKDAPIDIMREALRYVIRGERYIAQHATEVLLQSAVVQEKHKDDLTQTEREVLKAIAQGKTTKEIAAERFSSIHTINSHRKNIFRKLGVNCAHDAMKYALRAGLVNEAEFYI